MNRSLITHAWRREPSGPDLRELLREQLLEEELYALIMAEARREDAVLNGLFFSMEKLAYPRAEESVLRLAADRDEAAMLHWRDTLDEDGNPRWISVNLPDRRDSDSTLAPPSVLPTETESAAPPQDALDKKASSPKKRQGFLTRLLRRFFNIAPEPTTLEVNPYERLRAARAAAAQPASLRKRFVFRMLRMALFMVIIYLVYLLLVRWGMLSPRG